MSRGIGQTLLELVNPNWVRHSTVPPLEAGLRPNTLLDTADPLLPGFEADDAVVLADGSVAFSSGSEVHVLRHDVGLGPFATFDGTVLAITARGAEVVAAVEGRGLVTIAATGQVADLNSSAVLRTCVTALSALPDGRVAATIGSATHAHAAWSHALVTEESSGSLVVVDGTSVVTLATGLPWPSGVCAGEDGELLLSLSLGHRIEKVIMATMGRTVVLGNLPAYPGRLSPHPDGWLVAFPYVRNRLSELLMEEDDFIEEMVRTIQPDEWMVPRLRNENPYTSALQLGQLRVLGVLKPWAPARSYGLIGLLDHHGRFATSYHSRVEGKQHGVTAAVTLPEGILAAVRGSRNVLMLKEGIR